MLNKLHIASLSLLSLCFLSGCGGGGGGGSTTSSPTSTLITVNGNIEDSNGNALVNYSVVDNADSLTDTTVTGGAFTLQLPAADSGTAVTLDFYNSAHQLVEVKQFNITAKSGGSQSLGTFEVISLGPPLSPA